MSFRVEFAPQAQDDLQRLYAFVLARELERDGGDLTLADRALEAISKGLSLLEWAPFTCRRAMGSALERELVVSFGASGYVVLFEVTGAELLLVTAVRHQREDDWLD